MNSPFGKQPAGNGSNEIVSDFQNDPDIAELLPEFVAALVEKVTMFRLMLEEQNLEGLRQAVHQLKGSGGGYGFQCLTDAAASAEKSIYTNAPLETISEQVDALVGLIKRVRGYDDQASRPQS